MHEVYSISFRDWLGLAGGQAQVTKAWRYGVPRSYELNKMPLQAKPGLDTLARLFTDARDEVGEPEPKLFYLRTARLTAAVIFYRNGRKKRNYSENNGKNTPW